MKRRLIYGLLICLFVCASGMVGYGQPNIGCPWGSCPEIGEISQCDANSWIFTLSGKDKAISIEGWSNVTITGEHLVCNNDNIYRVNSNGEFYVKLINGTPKSIVTSSTNPCSGGGGEGGEGGEGGDDDYSEHVWTIQVGDQANVSFPDGQTFVDGVVKIHGVANQSSGIVILRDGQAYFDFVDFNSDFGGSEQRWSNSFYGNIALGDEDAWVQIKDNKLSILRQKPPMGPSLQITLPNKRIYQNESTIITPTIGSNDVPDGYTISYEWYNNDGEKICEEEICSVPTNVIGRFRYRLVTTLKNEKGDVVKTYTNYSTVTIIETGGVLYPTCSRVERWVDGEYFDNYNLCTDNDGNITIDLTDPDNEFVFIRVADYYASKGHNPSSTISFNNNAIVCCKNVKYFFTNPIECENFIYKGDVAYNQGPDFEFVNRTTINCTKMSIEQGSEQKANRFKFSCQSVVYAQEKIYIDSYNNNSMVIYGMLVSPDITLENKNNSKIEINGCAYVKAENLQLKQSAQNDVKIQGHVIAENISSDANVVLTYDGELGHEAIITIGELKSNVLIACGSNTIVNLCKNPHLGEEDNIGFFNGIVLYNINPEDGWYGTVPSIEGDINKCCSKEYYTYYNNQGNIMGSSGFSLLNEVRGKGYSSYEDCINERNMAALLPIELISFNYQKGNNTFVWKTASETNNDYFVVEYSKNGKDWVECSGHVPAVSTKGYSYSVNPNMSINNSLFSYFRLKQVDNNGEYSYSNVITVSFSVENPCSEEFESSKLQIREFGNKWFRYINGELIYCENDN